MGTAARKARKRDLAHSKAIGEIADPDQFKFVHPEKAGTPLTSRALPPSGDILGGASGRALKKRTLRIALTEFGLTRKPRDADEEEEVD